MQTHVKPETCGHGKETKIKVQNEAGDWQQPHFVELRPALARNQPISLFKNIILPESGVPFSPLND